MLDSLTFLRALWVDTYNAIHKTRLDSWNLEWKSCFYAKDDETIRMAGGEGKREEHVYP